MALRLSIFAAILICASSFADKAEAVRAGAWFSTTSLPSARYLHTATLLRDGDVLVAGGSALDNGPPYGAASLAGLRYRAETRTWSPAGVLLTARDAPTATLLPDGRVLLLGGSDHWSRLPLASGELYNPVTNTWSSAAPMSERRAGHTATLLDDGRVLVIGGCAGLCDGRTHNDWAGGEIYDPAADGWTRVSDIPVKRTGHTATLLGDGRVLLVGGRASIWPAPAQVYEPTTDTWGDTPEIGINRLSHTATRLVDGSVMVVGGYTAPCIVGGICPFALGLPPEVYDPLRNAWTYIDGPTPSAHVATLLKSGQLLVTGGVDLFGHTVATADVYDPATGTWATADSMQTPRQGHTATLLKNGRVLVAGGYVSAAEIFKALPGRRP